MENGQIIVIDSVRKLLDDKQQTVIGRIITDKAGNETKVKKGQGGKLEDRWEWLDDKGAGQAIKLTVRQFKPPNSDKAYPYVADFEVVKDEFVAKAAEKVQTQVKVERNESIETQVAQKGGIEVLKVLIEQALLTNEEIQKCKEYAMSSVGWGMGRVNLPSVIVTKIEEAKSDTETHNDSETTDGQQGEERASGPPSGEALELQLEEALIKKPGNLLNWITAQDKNIKNPKVWLDAEFGISGEELMGASEKKLSAWAKTIKTKMGW